MFIQSAGVLKGPARLVSGERALRIHHGVKMTAIITSCFLWQSIVGKFLRHQRMYSTGRGHGFCQRCAADVHNAEQQRDSQKCPATFWHSRYCAEAHFGLDLTGKEFSGVLYILPEELSEDGVCVCVRSDRWRGPRGRDLWWSVVLVCS